MAVRHSGTVRKVPRGTRSATVTKARAPYPVVPPDLRAFKRDPWSRLSPPEGWEAIAETCRRVATRLPELTEHVVRCIAVEIEAYSDSIPDGDLSLSVLRNLEVKLLGIAERRDPSAEEIEIRRELGRRRAMQGVPMDALLEAYHIGYRELWDRLVDEASEVPGAPAQLLRAATTSWTWIHQITSAVLEGYQEVVHGREMYAVGARQRFAELILAGREASEEAIEAARSLGFDPGGPFRATYVRLSAVGGHEAALLQAHLSKMKGHYQCTPRGDALLIVSQDDDLAELEAAIRQLVSDASVGIGMERAGLEGARQSIGDAERALAIAARRNGTSRFEEDWFEATVLPWEERLREFLEPGAEACRRYPHLAAAVEAFARCSFSVSDVARTLSVHPNTVLYRLHRWQELTGWNPRSFEGLARSLAGISVGEAERAR